MVRCGATNCGIAFWAPADESIYKSRVIILVLEVYPPYKPPSITMCQERFSQPPAKRCCNARGLGRAHADERLVFRRSGFAVRHGAWARELCSVIRFIHGRQIHRREESFENDGDFEFPAGRDPLRADRNIIVRPYLAVTVSTGEHRSEDGQV